MGKTTPFRASNDELQICRRNEIAGTRLSAGRRRKGEPRFEREEPAVKGRVWRERGRAGRVEEEEVEEARRTNDEMAEL